MWSPDLGFRLRRRAVRAPVRFADTAVSANRIAMMAWLSTKMDVD